MHARALPCACASRANIISSSALSSTTCAGIASLHIKNILGEGELDNSVVEESSVTARDGKNFKTKSYNLDMILAITPSRIRFIDKPAY